jgi:hypothetical protein
MTRATPVSRPYPMHQAVITAGRRPVQERRLPKLSPEATRLLQTMPLRDPDRLTRWFAESIGAKPSRAGVEVLDYCAAAFRRDGSADVADGLAQISAAIAELCRNTEATEAMIAKLTKVAEDAAKAAYQRGFADGHDDALKQLPSVLREKAFVTDSKGKITGSTEREYHRPGGNQ